MRLKINHNRFANTKAQAIATQSFSVFRVRSIRLKKSVEKFAHGLLQVVLW